MRNIKDKERNNRRRNKDNGENTFKELVETKETGIKEKERIHEKKSGYSRNYGGGIG